jgi:hypothetical protein
MKKQKMSGLVFVRYIRDQIIFLYNVASINYDEVSTNNFNFVSMGVFMGLHSNMSNLFKISTAYFHLLRKILSRLCHTQDLRNSALGQGLSSQILK